tara:strand:- start:372 stop:2093 length:1722 start_codon:yes stop_codon:yes gene_type:complete
MNIIQMQDRLKDLSDNQLRTYVENPRNMQGSGVGQGGTSGGYVPTFLVLGEIKRRKDSRSKYQGEKAQQKTTVADDLVKEQGIGGNQMTRNPMSQPTAGVGTPQPQEPVNPAMLAKKGIGQLDPGAVKQMNDGGIVGYAGTDGVSLVGEDKPGLKEIQAQNQQTDYSLGNFIQQASDYNDKYFGEASVAPPPTGSYSKVGEFFSSFTDPENPTERLEKNRDKALQLVNEEKLKYSYGIFDKMDDKEREFADRKLLELADIEKNLLDDSVGPQAPEEIISETTTDETITKDVGQGNSNQGLSGDEPPTSGAADFLNNMAMEKQREEMIEKGYNRFNPAGGPVEPVKDYTVAEYQKEVDEANKAFGIEDREAFFANRKKLIESEKEDIRKEQQDDLNANLMQTGLRIAQTGDIFGQGAEGVERYSRSTKDARKMKKLVDKEMRAVDGMERAEARGDAKGYMKERKVRKDTQLAQIKMNMDAYGDYLKSQADRFGKRSKDWIAAVAEATKIHGSSQANVAARYAGNDAAFKRDIYVTATEIFGGKVPEFIDPGSAKTAKERGPGIYTKTTDSYWSS